MLGADKKQTPVSVLLVVDNLDQAVDFYFRAFGALESERYADPAGHVWYAVVDVLGMPIQLMEPFPDMGLVAAEKGRPVGDAMTLTIDLPAVEESFANSVRNGAEPISAPRALRFGVHAEIRDPFGHRWTTGTRLPKVDRRRAPVTANLIVKDVKATAAFMTQVFGATGPVRLAGPKPERADTVLRIGRGPIQIMAEADKEGLVAHGPQGRPGGDTAILTVTVDDVDGVFQRAKDLGATTIIEPHLAYWGDRYSEFRLPEGLRAAGCGDQSINSLIDPPDAQLAFRTFLESNDTPVSPAQIVNVQNV